MKHYLALTGELTDNAIAELVAHEEQKKTQEETKEAPKLDSKVGQQLDSSWTVPPLFLKNT